MKIESSE
jgi:hypothetical protein